MIFDQAEFDLRCEWGTAGVTLSGTHSPEAEAAIAAFHQAKARLANLLTCCSSGKELIARGFAEDVELASQFNLSTSVPMLIDGAYANQEFA